MKKRVLSVITAACMFTALFTGCLQQDAKKPAASAAPAAPAATAAPAVNKDAKIIKVSNGVNATHPLVVSEIEVFKKIVEEKTKGRFKVEVYHSSQLGDDTKGTESVRAGTLELCVTSTSPLVGLIKELQIFDIPFLFANEKVADAVLDGAIGQKLSELLESKAGVVNLGWGENGFRNLTNSAKEIKAPADLKGLKIRTMENPVHLATWRALGANPTPMAFSEVFTALQQKAIDGEENPVPIISSMKFYEVNKYITLTGHVYTPVAYIFSKQIFNTYSKEDQQIIRDAVKETIIAERKLNREAITKNLEEMKKAGNVVTELTADQKKAFQDLTAPVWSQVEEKVGADLIKQLKEEVAKANK